MHVGCQRVASNGPFKQQYAEVRSINEPVTVEIGRARTTPLQQEEADVLAINPAIAIEIGDRTTLAIGFKVPHFAFTNVARTIGRGGCSA